MAIPSGDRHGDGAARTGNPRWRRLCEERCGGKSVFHFDVQGSVAKSSHAGIPWLRQLARANKQQRCEQQGALDRKGTPKTVYCTKQFGNLLRRPGRCDALTLGSGYRAPQFRARVALSSTRRDRVPEHPADFAAHPMRGVVRATLVDTTQHTEHIEGRSLDDRLRSPPREDVVPHPRERLHIFPPEQEIRAYNPPPSNIQTGLSIGLALRMAASVRDIEGTLNQAAAALGVSSIQQTSYPKMLPPDTPGLPWAGWEFLGRKKRPEPLR